MGLIKGSIGFLDMTSWWLDELSYKERETILSVYNPIGNSSDNLINGDVISTTEEPISSGRDRTLLMKFEQADRL
ncbi:hypothetical protein [Aeromonas rivipollensis]|uniref:hypothetical protein n=1 Tax=Aeromonas rivipollensis TaxID=948519 RepID=UPI0038D23066